jgi:hypothetical protein
LSSGVSRGCRRLHVDLPVELYERIRSEAAEPPSISVAEWARRLIAWRVNYDLPKASERERLGIRVTGEIKRKPGRKKKSAVANV